MREEITEYERLARRRIRYLTPLNASKVLAHPRYWTVAFLSLFLETCDETCFHDPEAGYLLAQHAPELARRIATDGDGGYACDGERRGFEIRALAVWGSCCRAYGELTRSETAYCLAYELIADAPEQETVSDEVLGEVRARHGVLLMCRGESRDALPLLDGAVELFERGGSDRRLADTLAIRGLARYLTRDPDSLMDLTAALDLIDAKTPQGRRTLAAVLHNMALAISRGGVTTQAQEWAYKLLVETKKQIQRPRSAQKTKIIWLEGLLLVRLGMTRLAERRLLKAYRALTERRQGLEVAAICLDLVCLYLDEGDDEAARAVAEEAYDFIRSRCDDPQVLQAAQRWRGDLPFSESVSKPICFESSRALQQSLYGLTFGQHSACRKARPAGGGIVVPR